MGSHALQGYEMRCCPEHVKLRTMLEVGTPKIECNFEEIGNYIWRNTVVKTRAPE